MVQERNIYIYIYKMLLNMRGEASFRIHFQSSSHFHGVDWHPQIRNNNSLWKVFRISLRAVGGRKTLPFYFRKTISLSLRWDRPFIGVTNAGWSLEEVRPSSKLALKLEDVYEITPMALLRARCATIDPPRTERGSAPRNNHGTIQRGDTARRHAPVRHICV